MSRSRRDFLERLASLAADYNAEAILAELALAYDSAGVTSFGSELASRARHTPRRLHRLAEEELANLLALAEDPTVCSCRKSYTPEAFGALPPPASGAITYDDELRTLEMRNCSCGSTISRRVNLGGVR